MLRILKLAKNKTILFIKIFILKKYEPIDLWFWKNGDNTLRLNYPLKQTSLVFDLGGYKGEWTEKIYFKYKPNIWVFEPVKFFNNELKNKFRSIASIRIFDFGFSDHNGNENINLNEDGTSLFNFSDTNSHENIVLRDINEFIEEQKIETIELMKINIEGSEYELMESLLKSRNITRIKNIQIQFHPWIPDAIKKRENIRKELSYSHKETFNFPFIWENWELR